MAFPNSPPTRHSMRMHPLCSWRQWFSPPFPLTGAGMRARRHSVDQPHVEVRLARLSAAALAAASPYSYYRPPRPGLSVSHHARRPLVPGAHASRKLSPYAAATMVVSDELPKASSKERGGGGKVNFFFENLSLVPETIWPRYGRSKIGPRHFLEVTAYWELPS